MKIDTHLKQYSADVAISLANSVEGFITWDIFQYDTCLH